MTPKSPSDFIGKSIESDDQKFCVVCKYEVCSHAFLRKEVDQLEEALTLERSEADKLRGEVERLSEIKPIIEALKSGKERGTITIDREAFKVLYAEEIGSLRQQLADTKGDCHCGESHRLKLQLAETKKELSALAIDVEKIATKAQSYHSQEGCSGGKTCDACEIWLVIDEILTKLRGEK